MFDLISYYKYTIDDVRKIMKSILIGVKEAHNRKVIHRDLKPGNIIIDSTLRTARIIDWGLAEFCEPGKQYNVRVATMPFKPPELLLENQVYDESLDVWGAGCVFGCLVS